MSLLANLTVSNEIEGEKDNVGGGFSPLETAIYKVTVTLAYLQKAASGALGLHLNLMTESGREVRQTVYLASGDKKGNKNYYVDKNGDKQYLPGFNVGNSLAYVTTGKNLPELEPEKKTINLYSPDAKAEVPTQVDMLTELMGKEVYMAIFKQIEDKNVRGDDGVYRPTGETRETNEIDKFFRAEDKKTSMEIIGNGEAVFFDTWEQKWTGQVKDKSKGTSGNAGAPAQAQPGMPQAQAAAGTKPANSLFNSPQQ